MQLGRQLSVVRPRGRSRVNSRVLQGHLYLTDYQIYLRVGSLSLDIAIWSLGLFGGIFVLI